jgi:hypothetical protein
MGAIMIQRTKSYSKMAPAGFVPLLLALLFIPTSAAQAFQPEGQWSYSRTNTRGQQYWGTITFDASGRATDQHRGSGRSDVVGQNGIVSDDGGVIDIKFNSIIGVNYNPDHFRCNVASDREMKCSNTDAAGVSTNSFTLSRDR